MSAEFWWTVGTTVILVAFNVGIVYQKLRTFATKEELIKVESDIKEAIDSRLENHCPNVERIKKLEADREKNSDIVHNLITGVQEIKINVKGICEKLEVKYKTGNGG